MRSTQQTGSQAGLSPQCKAWGVGPWRKGLHESSLPVSPALLFCHLQSILHVGTAGPRAASVLLPFIFLLSLLVHNVWRPLDCATEWMLSSTSGGVTRGPTPAKTGQKEQQSDARGQQRGHSRGRAISVSVSISIVIKEAPKLLYVQIGQNLLE